jgi:hypothetical protein
MSAARKLRRLQKRQENGDFSTLRPPLDPLLRKLTRKVTNAQRTKKARRA